MAVTFKRQDDLDKLFEEFASFDELEKVEFPKEKADNKAETSDKKDTSSK